MEKDSEYRGVPAAGAGDLAAENPGGRPPPYALKANSVIKRKEDTCIEKIENTDRKAAKNDRFKRTRSKLPGYRFILR